jgi:hypothetical protein
LPGARVAGDRRALRAAAHRRVCRLAAGVDQQTVELANGGPRFADQAARPRLFPSFPFGPTGWPKSCRSALAASRSSRAASASARARSACRPLDQLARLGVAAEQNTASAPCGPLSLLGHALQVGEARDERRIFGRECPEVGQQFVHRSDQRFRGGSASASPRKTVAHGAVFERRIVEHAGKGADVRVAPTRPRSMVNTLELRSQRSVLARHVDEDARVAVIAEIDAPDAADGKTGEGHVHTHGDAFRIVGDQDQPLAGLEHASGIKQIGARAEQQKEHQQQQQRCLQLEVPDHRRGVFGRTNGRRWLRLGHGHPINNSCRPARRLRSPAPPRRGGRTPLRSLPRW